MGNLACFPAGKPEWWTCPRCGGAGASAVFISGKPIRMKTKGFGIPRDPELRKKIAREFS